MGFSDNIKKHLLSSYTGSLVDVFYKPLLSEATLYQRVSAYFTSEGLDLIIDGIEELVRNDGTMEFIFSKKISKEDYEKIHSGYNLYNELKPLKLAERNEKLINGLETGTINFTDYSDGIKEAAESSLDL